MRLSNNLHSIFSFIDIFKHGQEWNIYNSLEGILNNLQLHTIYLIQFDKFKYEGKKGNKIIRKYNHITAKIKQFKQPLGQQEQHEFQSSLIAIEAVVVTCMYVTIT